MICINTKCHSYCSDNTCAIPQHFTDRPCYELIIPQEPEAKEESGE